MTTMKAVGRFAPLPIADVDSLVDLQVERPAPGPRDLLVRVEAVSVNPVDVKQRRRLPAADEAAILGYDAAGTIEAVGGAVEGFAVGDEVYYAGTINRPGSNAEFQLVDERIVAAKPAGLSFAEAAAIPLTAITAWESLFDRFGLTADSSGDLLIMGAAGGVGSAMIQLAKRLTGVRVLASASREESRAWVRELGADEVVDHSDLEATVTAVAPDGVDYIFTPQSAGNLPSYAELIKPFGKITAIDDVAEVDLGQFKAKSVAWLWESMFTRPVHQTPDLIEQQRLLTAVAEMVAAGTYRSPVQVKIDDFSAAGLREAHALIESGHTVGKIVVHR